MKKIILVLLVTQASTGHLFAQIDDKKMQQRMEEYLEMNKTEKTFRMSPSLDRRKFVFHLGKGNQLIFNMERLEQVHQIPDVDSVLRIVWNELQPFKEKFSRPLTNVRIDFNMDITNHNIRFLEFKPVSEVYRIAANDTVQLEMEQDTLSVRLYAGELNLNVDKTFRSFPQPFYITLLLNSITDLPSVAKEDIDWAVRTLKNDVVDRLAKSKQTKFDPVQAAYSVTEKKKLSSTPLEKKRKHFYPIVLGAFQHVRGGWAPSAGVGVEYGWRQYKIQTSYVRLYWEPYFFFSRTDDKKTVLDRTDFITVVYGDRLLEEQGSRQLEFALHFTAAYAIRTPGGWFEKNTFKISFPGLEYENIMLYPEFNFHDLLKGFNPSMKLVVNLE